MQHAVEHFIDINRALDIIMILSDRHLFMVNAFELWEDKIEFLIALDDELTVYKITYMEELMNIFMYRADLIDFAMDIILNELQNIQQLLERDHKREEFLFSIVSMLSRNLVVIVIDILRCAIEKLNEIYTEIRIII